jgi:hypothetical protein
MPIAIHYCLRGHIQRLTAPGSWCCQGLGETEAEFSTCTFNTAGDKLATCGADPDFMLTVWQWEEERIILRCKAFGTRILRLSFMRTDDGQLTSCGMAGGGQCIPFINKINQAAK